MKKRITKQVTAFAAALMFALSVSMAVYGAEEAGSSENSSVSADRTVITDIYHKHIGDATKKGGCYQEEIPHVHQGNEADGGDCFKAPVYHSHQGSAEDGSGCYNQPVYHVHDGDSQQGGSCYTKSCHSHEDDCYESAICTVHYTKGAVIETFTKDCFDHPQTTYERAEGTATHSDCGMGEESVELVYCQICGIYTPGYHDYQKLVCGFSEGEVTGYELTCGMTEGDIESYETGCGKDDTSVEYYLCTCDKVTEGYQRNCGLTESVPCGRLIITNETAGKEEKVWLKASLEDFFGGKLILSEEPYVWYDEDGTQIGKGDRIEVTENGNYSIEVKLKNKDVDESGLHSMITVDNVSKEGGSLPSQTPGTPTPTAGQEDLRPSESETPDQDAGQDSNENQDREENESASDGKENIEKELLIPVKEPVATSGKNVETNSKSKAAALSESATRRVFSRKAEEEEAPFPTGTGELAVTKVTEKLPELSATGPSSQQPETVASSFWKSPVVRMCSLALGTVVFLAGVILLLWYLRRSVRIYNDDGSGNLVYLGRCLVRLEEEGYAITISDKMSEKAYTNRYCIKPGLFLLGKKEGEELLVCSEKQRTSVYLCREMIVVIC